MNDDVLNVIKQKQYNESMKIMEGYIEEELSNKLNEKIDINQYSFIQFIDYCITKLPDYYDILTYTRNIYFFTEKTDQERLNELINVYKNLKI